MATQAPLKILTPPHGSATNQAAVEDIRDVKPPVSLPNGWFWLTLALTLLVLAIAGWWGWRKWREHQAKKRKAAAATPPVPPSTRARERLQAALQLISQPEPFCVAVSNALRAYLEERFSLHAPERTTEEFLYELQSSEVLDANQKASLSAFLSRCDLVKFARHEPPEAELLELHAAALRLIDETAPRFVPPPEPGSPARSRPHRRRSH